MSTFGKLVVVLAYEAIAGACFVVSRSPLPPAIFSAVVLFGIFCYWAFRPENPSRNGF